MNRFLDALDSRCSRFCLLLSMLKASMLLDAQGTYVFSHTVDFLKICMLKVLTLCVIWQRQAEAWILLLAGAVEVNALSQVALRRFIQWPWIEHPTVQFRGGRLITELLPSREFITAAILWLFVTESVTNAIASTAGAFESRGVVRVLSDLFFGCLRIADSCFYYFFKTFLYCERICVHLTACWFQSTFDATLNFRDLFMLIPLNEADMNGRWCLYMSLVLFPAWTWEKILIFTWILPLSVGLASLSIIR